MSKNLWGSLDDLERVQTPKSLLEQQASILTDVTKGLLVGKVDENVTSSTFRYDLDVEVPTLNHYVYTLLTIRHTMELYPLRIMSQSPQREILCENESAFEAALSS